MVDKIKKVYLLGAEMTVEHAPVVVLLDQRAVHVEGDELVPHILRQFLYLLGL